ncbi:MAG: hypothetical protein JKY65_29595 [Planctomycetes bacterium]|nr:hypothetical protein [Planctomycetota bacterium]
MRLVVAQRIRDSLKEAIPYGYADDIHEALSRLVENPELGVLLNDQGDRLYTFRVARLPSVYILSCVYTVREEAEAIYVGRITCWNGDEDENGDEG